jgi:hypothetical protein
MRTHKSRFFSLLALLLATLSANSASSDTTWYFAVSGDSRNCGDVIMPAIAADAREHHVAFYWHLGDLRKISSPDQDFIQEQARAGKAADLAFYEDHAWEDFILSQIQPWGKIDFYLGIGNHETIPPKTRAAFVEEFRRYLDRPDLREQRLKDDPSATEPRTYYHWVRDGIDFINLDNATQSAFDADELHWIEGMLDRDGRDARIHTIVAGMHEALPESISRNHSMNESPSGTESGRRVYNMLLKAQNHDHKTVYVLASHSHYFMDGIFNTEYWKTHGGILPGWIVGTAGAERYPLPPRAGDARMARTNVYGYLLATVNRAGETAPNIQFEFRELKEEGVPPEVVQRFTKPFVHECFAGNRRAMPIE